MLVFRRRGGLAIGEAAEPEVLPDEAADPEGEPGGEDVGVADDEGAKAGLLGGEEEAVDVGAGGLGALGAGHVLGIDAEVEEL